MKTLKKDVEAERAVSDRTPGTAVLSAVPLQADVRTDYRVYGLQPAERNLRQYLGWFTAFYELFPEYLF